METMLNADCDAMVLAVHVASGDVVSAQDLLIELT